MSSPHIINIRLVFLRREAISTEYCVCPSTARASTHLSYMMKLVIAERLPLVGTLFHLCRLAMFGNDLHDEGGDGAVHDLCPDAGLLQPLHFLLAS